MMTCFNVPKVRFCHIELTSGDKFVEMFDTLYPFLIPIPIPGLWVSPFY